MNLTVQNESWRSMYWAGYGLITWITEVKLYLYVLLMTLNLGLLWEEKQDLIPLDHDSKCSLHIKDIFVPKSTWWIWVRISRGKKKRKSSKAHQQHGEYLVRQQHCRSKAGVAISSGEKEVNAILRCVKGSVIYT